MRRSLPIAFALLASGSLVACEDGPAQTYTPPPSGAANVWNNGNTGSTPLPGVVGSASQSFVGSNSGGTNSAIICSGSVQAARWATMDTYSVALPNVAAGLDEAGFASTCTAPGVGCGPPGLPTWQGLTIEQAEQVNCQGTYEGDAFGDGNEDIAWGGGQEVLAEYIVSSQKIDYLGLNVIGPGYLGTLVATSPDKSTTYTIQMNEPIEITNNTTGATTAAAINWNGAYAGNPADVALWDNLYRALLATFFSGMPQPAAGVTCNQTGACIIGEIAGQYAYFYMPAFGFGLWNNEFYDPVAGQFIQRLDMYLTQLMNYATANPNLQLSAAGPSSIPLGLGLAPNNTTCTLTLGMNFSNFLSDCVETDGNATDNAVEEAKLVSSMTHDEQTFNFNIPGIDLNFNDALLNATETITDNVFPQAGDTANEMNVDQSTEGSIAQDWIFSGTPQMPTLAEQDLHGAGALWDEYRKLVVTNVLSESGETVPANIDDLIYNCIAPRNATTGALLDYPAGSGGFDPSAWLAHMQTLGCTGAENLLSADKRVFTAGPVSLDPNDNPVDLGGTFGADPNLQGLSGTQAITDIDPNYSLGMKMGHQKGIFCLDAVSINMMTKYADYLKSIGSPASPLPQFCVAEGDVLATTAAQVWAVQGKGNNLNMVADIQDFRFFFKQYGQALIKVLEWAGDWDYSTIPFTPPAATVDSYPIDFDALFFDSIGAGQFEQMEYIDRRYVCNDSTPAHPDNDCATSSAVWQAPLDIVFGADVKDGIMNNYDITRYLYRGETAIYTALQSTDPATGGTYAVGSQDALMTNIVGSTLLTTQWKSYKCATTDPNNPHTTATQIEKCGGLAGVAPVDSQTGKTMLDENGNLLLSEYALAWSGSPFALGGSNIVIGQTFEFSQQALMTVPTLAGSTTTELVPWTPMQQDVGFQVAVDGEYYQFVETAQLDFSGVTVSSVFDVVPEPNPADSTGATQLGNLLAVESTDFLGKLFVCYDSTTGDVMTAQMYDDVATEMAWLDSHPNAYSECNLYVHWSPYNNFVDSFESTTNGVYVDTTQGGGFGRIVGAVTYLPGNYGVQ